MDPPSISQPNLRFWIKSDEQYRSPLLSDNKNNKRTWNEVKGEFARIFPHIPADAYPPQTEKQSRLWKTAVSACYGNPNEVTIWLLEPGGGSTTDFPEKGHAVRIVAKNAFGSVATSHLAHELGHFFGVRHTFSLDRGSKTLHTQMLFKNPRTGHKWNWSDLWDLIYYPVPGRGSSTTTFFRTRRDFVPYPDREPLLIARHTIRQGDKRKRGGHQENRPYVELWSTFGGSDRDGVRFQAGDLAVNGLFRDFGGAHDPGSGRFRYGINVMDYFSEYGFKGPDLRAPAFFSDSQIRIVKAYANYETNLVAEIVEAIRRPDGRLPRGCRRDFNRGRRPKLGKSNSVAR